VEDPIGPLPDAVEPGFHGVRSALDPGFHNVSPGSHARIVMLVVLV
jgi:hypothetical protein